MFEHHFYHVGVVLKAPKQEKKCDVSKNMYALKGNS